MQRPRFLAKRWIIAMSIIMIFVALVIWTIRPSPFSEWLGSAELSNFSTPLSILRAWADDRLAPMTPIGFITLFPLFDLLILAALLTALCILLVMLPTQWRNQQTGSWWTRPVSLHRLPRIGIRVRTAMVLIAILGLDLGWEIVAWRSWRLRQKYLGQAGSYGRSEAHWRDGILQSELQLAGLDREAPALAEDSRTPAARAAQRAYSRDLWQRESQHASREAAYYAELRRKYERAAADLPTYVPPDPPPLSEQQQPYQGGSDSAGEIRGGTRRIRRADPALPRPGLGTRTTRLDPGDLPRCQDSRWQARRRGGHARGGADQLEGLEHPPDACRRVRRGWRFRQRRALGTTRRGVGARLPETICLRTLVAWRLRVLSRTGWPCTRPASRFES